VTVDCKTAIDPDGILTTLPRTPPATPPQIDNYFEVHGYVADFWGSGGCASIRVTSILGDTVEDSLCCTSGTCEGKAQLPCRSDMPGC
jgi:hypothetical protein